MANSWKISARCECLENCFLLLDRYALFICNTRGKRSMKPIDIRAIIRLAGSGNGMNNMLKQHNKPTAIVRKHLKCVEAWNPPPRV